MKSLFDLHNIVYADLPIITMLLISCPNPIAKKKKTAFDVSVGCMDILKQWAKLLYVS